MGTTRTTPPEANLDIQYSEAMAYPTPHTYYSTGNGPLGRDDPYLAWLRYMLDDADLPRTISTSYANYEKSVPRRHARAVCNLFALLRARGVSVLFATGDWGVGQGKCKTANENVRFMPTFPRPVCVTSFSLPADTGRSPRCHPFAGPYLTSVGGTTGHDTEVAADLSGGGFSDYSLRPKYQDEAVSTFFENLGNTYNGFYKCVCFRDPSDFYNIKSQRI